jgi:hypothetical protein
MRIHLTLDVPHIDQDDTLFMDLLALLAHHEEFGLSAQVNDLFGYPQGEATLQLADLPFEVQAGVRTDDMPFYTEPTT